METTIYMPLLNEGTDVWSPVLAQDLGGGLYSVSGRPCEGEQWAFAAGATVIVNTDRRIVSMANVS